MKKISVIVPCFNEEKSVHKMSKIIKEMFENKLKQYDYELIFIDDYSSDNTRIELEKICRENKKIKAIFNAKNFGFNRNVFYSLTQGTGDAVFLVFGDLQDPPELLVDFIEKWEQGYKVILGQKLESKENKFVYILRSIFYKLMDKMSQIKQIQHFNGFGLYDRDFIKVIKKIDDPQPYLKGIVGEFGMKQSIINYNQEKSARGKSNFNFFKYYDVVMLAVTSYTKILMRIATFIGGFVGIISLVIAIIIFINKILNWNTYPIGVAALTVGVFFIGAVQLFFIGILGEYILSINTRTLKRPLVVVEKKINFEDGDVEIEEYNS
ncbi:glycosyltransferase family 2 protein [Clostridioides difficile]